MRKDPVLHFLAMCVICMAAVFAFCSCAVGEVHPEPEPVDETEPEETTGTVPPEKIEDAGTDGPVYADASKF